MIGALGIDPNNERKYPDQVPLALSLSTVIGVAQLPRYIVTCKMVTRYDRSTTIISCSTTLGSISFLARTRQDCNSAEAIYLAPISK